MRKHRATAAPTPTAQMARHGRVRPLRALLLAVAVAAGAGISAADDLTRFELDDGSVIVGEPLGLTDGVFRIRTQTLGDIDIEVTRIRRMQQAGADAAADGNAAGADAFGATGNNAAPAGYASQIQALQQSMVSDTGIMESIMALQQDPELRQAMQDPELMGLITSGNVEALRNHEAFGRLMNHPGIRAIIEQLTGGEGGVP